LQVNWKNRFAMGCAIAVVALAQMPASAQTQMMNARMTGNGNGSGGGKCTFEVTVQGRAEVQIRGTQGRLVTQSGNPASWRRLDCNAPLPYNPTGFRFSGVDGHGRQSLASDPNSNNGVAVIQIDNGNRGNNEGYTGDITWNGGGNANNQGWGNNGGGHRDHDRDGGSGNNGGNGNWGNNGGNGNWNNNQGWGNTQGGWNNNGGWNGNNGNWGNQGNQGGRWGNYGNAAPQYVNAKISGNGGGSGKCTFEVVVQGRAEVQIRGDQGRLITDSGNPAQWRRLDCNQPLPRNPANFRFNGVDGQGRQSLAADPNSNNGVAIIQIDNGNRGNNEGYTGDITWR
jgi:hypothetical protein